MPSKSKLRRITRVAPVGTRLEITKGETAWNGQGSAKNRPAIFKTASSAFGVVSALLSELTTEELTDASPVAQEE